MFEKSEAFDLYISELLDVKLKNLAVTDGEYAGVKAKTAFEADALEGDFNMQEIRIIEDFHGLLCNLSAIENRYLYFEGFKDCIRLLKRLEGDLSISAAGRAKLEFMKEHELELYVELVEQDRLVDYLREFSREFTEQVDYIAGQMGGDANARACAREIVYAQAFERGEDDG